MLLPPTTVRAGADQAVVLQQSTGRDVGPITIHLEAADAATVMRVVGEALGATVRVEGEPGRVTLDLPHATVRGALDAVAAALHGSWRPVYVIAAVTPGDALRHPVSLGRTVTATLEGVGPRTAFATVARAAGGTVEMRAELASAVKLSAKDTPVEEAFDAIARQAGASWSVTYLFQVGTVPTPAEILPPSNVGPRTNPARGQIQAGTGSGSGQITLPGGSHDILADPRSFPIPFADEPPATTASPRDPSPAQMLGDGLARVMQMPPAQRRGAVKDFAAQIDQQFRQMQSLPPARRSEQMASMAPLRKAATRVYDGLTPNLRKEFEPIIQVLNRWLR